MKWVPIERFFPDPGWIALARAGDPSSVVCIEFWEFDTVDCEGFTQWAQVIAPTVAETAREWAVEGHQLVDAVVAEAEAGRPFRPALKALARHVKTMKEVE